MAAGISSEKVEGYLRRAGQVGYTRTHGRREVAFLNRAWEDVTALDYTMDTAARSQPMLDRAVNRRLVRCAGFDGLGRAEERFLYCLERREGQ